MMHCSIEARARTALRMAVALVLLAMPACDRILPQRPDVSLPDIADIEAIYREGGIAGTVRYSGNVVELVVQQPAEQLRRGGTLWARVGPYIYLFSPATRRVIETYPGIAGVRVITQAGGNEVARALLVRDRLNEVTWPRAIAILSQALEHGTARPATMNRLVQFGEEMTEYEYSTRYVPQRER